MKQEQRRRLTDLYSRGAEYPVTGPDGEVAVTVWVRKMTPADAEVAYLKASAKRASVLAMRAEEDTATIDALNAQLEQLGKDDLVTWQVTSEVLERRPEIETKIAFEEEWANENYLLSLQERASEASFKQKCAEFPDEDEVLRVNAELARYNDQIEAELTKAEDDARARFSEWPIQQLRDAVLDQMIEAQANASWLAEFQRCQVWKCVFDPEHKNDPYFATREEVDQVQIEVLSQLFKAVEEVHVSEAEGKDSPPNPTS